MRMNLPLRGPVFRHGRPAEDAQEPCFTGLYGARALWLFLQALFFTLFAGSVEQARHAGFVVDAAHGFADQGRDGDAPDVVHLRMSSVAAMESVITIDLSFEFWMRWTAPPESTPCVA